MAQYGTISVNDSYPQQAWLNVIEFGEDNLYSIVQAYIDAHNRIVQDMMGGLIENTTDRMRRWGGRGARMRMQKRDEFGRPAPQKNSMPTQTVGFPLEAWTNAVQWTRMALEELTVQEVMLQTDDLRLADLMNLYDQVVTALMRPTNYTFRDYLMKAAYQIDLPVVALANADSTILPLDPWGNSFDSSTHTHYLATNTFTAATLKNLIVTVKEHYSEGDIRVYLNIQQEDAIRGFTGFTPLQYGNITPPALTTTLPNPDVPLDVWSSYDRMIGYFDMAEIWVKPWMPTNYLLCHNTANVPLAMRVPENNPQKGEFRLVASDEHYPLRIDYSERLFGIGVQDRLAAAVLYVGGSTYVAPAVPVVPLTA
jgi:hypothetical protein